MPKISRANTNRRGKVRMEHSGVHNMNDSVDLRTINDTVVVLAEWHHSALALATLNTDDEQFYEKLNKALVEISKNLTQLEIYNTTMDVQKEYAELASMLSPNFIVLANKLALQLYGDQAPSFFLE